MDDALTQLLRAAESFARAEERRGQCYHDRDGTLRTTEEWAALVDTLEAEFRARLASSSGRAAEPGREERVLRLAAAKLRDMAADADRRGHDGTARAHRAHAAELESLAGGLAAGEGEAGLALSDRDIELLHAAEHAFTPRSREAAEFRNLRDRIKVAALASRAPKTPDEEKLPHRPPQTEDGA